MTENALTSADIDAIEQMMEEWTSSLVSRDWPAWQSHWAEDGVLMPPDDARIVGRADLVAFASERFGVVRSFAFSDWTVDGLGDLAVVTNTIRLEFDGAGSEPTTAANDQMLLLHKHADGNWRVHKVIFNGSGPA